MSRELHLWLSQEPGDGVTFSVRCPAGKPASWLWMRHRPRASFLLSSLPPPLQHCANVAGE